MVGDDAQSIYSFRAATVRNILDFPHQFSPKAEIITLDQNYRSTQPILAAANAVIDFAAERFTKNLWSDRRTGERPALVTVRDEGEQARYVVEQVLANRECGSALKAQAVLFRASHHSGPLEIELTRRNIPFVKFGGLKFLEAAHVKDVLALLRFLENPRDRVAGFRILLLLPGVGPVAAARILDELSAGGPGPTSLRVVTAPSRAAEAWSALVGAIEELRQASPGWPAELERVCAWYDPHLERRHEDAVVRRADLAQLVQIASTYPSRERFLTELTLDPPGATSDEAGTPHLDEDYLILSTIHSAKGQEWTSVFVLNAVDGCIPFRPRDRHHGRGRRGTAATLCGNDPRQRQPSFDCAAALLRASAGQPRRPSPLCDAHTVHPRSNPRSVREPQLAGGKLRPPGGRTAPDRPH